ncbi:MAG: outer rane beta-barrel protein, partial [Flaviaesturariibacter sp.]|nr:outer rane beta-barrel protein [Flaviaesturariibacter sp.]
YSTYRGKKNFSANASYAPISNSIVNATYYNDLRQQVAQAINVSGIYTASGNASFSYQIKKGIRVEQWYASAGGNYGRNVFFQKSGQYATRNYSIRSNAGFSRRASQAEYADGFSVNASAFFNRSLTPQNAGGLDNYNLTLTPGIELMYSISKIVHFTTAYRYTATEMAYSANNVNRYRQHSLNQTVYVPFSPWCRLESNLAYLYDTQSAFGTSPQTITWNASVSANFLKRHAALVKLSAFDLLNTNRNVRRSVGTDYIEDVQTVNLRNYFTLLLQYNFNRIKKQEQRSMHTKP